MSQFMNLVLISSSINLYVLSFISTKLVLTSSKCTHPVLVFKSMHDLQEKTIQGVFVYNIRLQINVAHA